MTTHTHRVATTLSPGANPFEFSVACEVFGLARPELGPPLYEHRLVARERPVEINGGWRLETPHDLTSLAWADTIVVPAGPRDPHPELVAALRAAHGRGARLVSFCSGVFVLAAAGVLDGLTAATHWLYVDELRRRYPAIHVDGEVLYVDEGQVLTSAGTAAAIDLALHLVRTDHGAEAANQVARRMIVPPHRDGGQAQFAHSPVAPTVDGDPLAPVLEWMLEHLDQPVTVAQLARMAVMSERSFARRFGQLTGTTPLRWLQHQRVARAQELLEVTDLTIEVIAQRVGLGTAANLRQHFRRATATTPAAYRARFRRSPAA